MKKRTRVFCLLLALLMLLSLLPLGALATENEGGLSDTPPASIPEEGSGDGSGSDSNTSSTYPDLSIPRKAGSTSLGSLKIEAGKKVSVPKYYKSGSKYYEYSYAKKGSEKCKVPKEVYDGTNADLWKGITLIYKSHKHSYHPGYSRTYHWKICACGHTTNKAPHIDPATDDDKICTCGYKFSDNAQLTTLWLTNMTLSPKFNKETTEYIGTVRTYHNVTSTKITARPFDALATVVLPENKEIHDGYNKYEIHVTAEDKTTTKVYTVIAVKPTKVEQSLIGFDGSAVSATMKAPAKKKIATATPSDAVLAKTLEIAIEEKAPAIALVPEFSKWSTDQVEILLPASFLKDMTEKTEASLMVKTPYESTLTIPREQVLSLAESDSGATLCVRKDNTFDIFTAGEPITAFEKITLTVPET